MINNDKRQEAIDLATGFILADATYFRPADLTDLDLKDYDVKVIGDSIRLIHKTEGIQLGNTESLSYWMAINEDD